MTKAKLENGYTPIANELLEAITRYSFTKREYKILLAIMRKTYGYHKTKDRLAGSQLAELTGLDRGNVAKTIGGLCDRSVLLKQQQQGGLVLKINPNIMAWSAVKTTAAAVKTTAVKDNLPLSKQQRSAVKTTAERCQNNSDIAVKTTHTKDKINFKDNLKKGKATTTPKKPVPKNPEKSSEIIPEKKFIKPTLAVVKKFCQDNKYKIDPEYFYDYYESNGWKIGRASMKDWQATIRNWNRREAGKQHPSSGGERRLSTVERIAKKNREADELENGTVIDA